MISFGGNHITFLSNKVVSFNLFSNYWIVAGLMKIALIMFQQNCASIYSIKISVTIKEKHFALAQGPISAWMQQLLHILFSLAIGPAASWYRNKQDKVRNMKMFQGGCQLLQFQLFFCFTLKAMSAVCLWQMCGSFVKILKTSITFNLPKHTALRHQHQGSSRDMTSVNYSTSRICIFYNND